MSSFRRKCLALADIVPVDNQWRYSVHAAYALGTMKLKVLTFIIQFRRELAATFAALAVFGVVNILRPTPDITVFAAAAHLSAGHVISESDLQPVLVNSRWPSAMTDINKLTGEVISHDINAGTPINQSDLLSDALTTTTDSKHKAVTVDISQSDATIASIGSHVDVFSASGVQISSHSLVLAMNQPERNTLALGSAQNITVVLNMNISEISQLARAKSDGNLTIATSLN